MKRIIIIGVVMVAAACIVCAFSNPPFDGNVPKPPPRSMADAYSMALQTLGAHTNDYYCVGSKITHDWCDAGEWVFTFDANFWQHKLVFVAMKPLDKTEVRDTGLVLDSANGASIK